jgi:hypothetical protein
MRESRDMRRRGEREDEEEDKRRVEETKTTDWHRPLGA